MPPSTQKWSLPYEQTLDLTPPTGQTGTTCDSLFDLVNPLPDPCLPPHDLVDTLRAQGLVDGHPEFQTLYGGRSNQVWKVLGGDGDKVLKLYASDFRNPLFRNDATLEAKCLQALDHTGFVPRLRAVGDHTAGQWVFYDHAPGSPWSEGVEEVAGLLKQLHGLDVSIPVPNGCNGSADLQRHGQDILGRCTSELRHRIDDARPVGDVPASARQCLVHGDPVAGNILVSPTGLTLIDWQSPARGDPCEDIAIFLSPAMQQTYRGAPLSREEEARFMVSYGDPETTTRYDALRRWYGWRMAAYCLWRVENGAPDYAAGLELELAAL